MHAFFVYRYNNWRILTKKNKNKFCVFFFHQQEFKCANVKPTINHYFMNEINKQGMLQSVLTQNIDGLEIDAGLPLDKCVQVGICL